MADEVAELELPEGPVPDPAAAVIEGRMMLTEITAFLAAYRAEPAREPRVQYALDMAAIAACERAVRILRSDLDALGVAE